MSRLPLGLLCSFGLFLGGPLAAQPASIPASVSASLSTQDYPGTLRLDVDASDIDRRIQRVRERIPVTAGPLTLWYPKWIPGNHAPTGPINQIAGLVITGNGQRIAWRRDPGDMYAFQLDVPAGVAEIEVAFQYLSPTSSSQGRVAMTPRMLSMQWHRVLLYPAGHDARRIRVTPTLRLPAGWESATALAVEARDGAEQRYATTDLLTLIDSPVYAGQHFRRFDLDTGTTPVRLNAMADTAAQLDASPAMLQAHRALVTQADRVFGPRPFAHYDFLLALSDSFSGIGLEHRQSSENGTYADYLRGDAAFIDNDLLPHEYVHAWSGKFRRPDTTWAPHYNSAIDNSLLWVYEGQTQYWAVVLAARAGLWTPEQARAVLANTLATAATQPGRDWRDLQDTVHQGIVDYNDAPQAWSSWQRGYDFYSEGSLLWLAVDARLREQSRGRRSLDDFAHRFHAGASADAPISLYGFDDVVRVLDEVQPGDWRGFLRERLDGQGAASPLDGLERAGWRLAYTDEPNPAITDAEGAGGNDDLRFSIGLKVASDGEIQEAIWNSPAFTAGLAKDMTVIAVDGLAYTGERLKRAIIAAKASPQPIELLVRQGEQYRSVRIDYRNGLRYPQLQRIPGTEDRLSKILAPR